MIPVRITIRRIVCHRDLMAEYENPLPNPCPHREGEVFLATTAEKPEGLCESAWQTLFPFVLALGSGGTGLYDGWMKNPRTAFVSCNDGFRPVSFLLEALPASAENT